MRTTCLILSVSAIIISALLAGTAGASPVTAGENERCVTVTDDLGGTVVIQGTPQRIVSLAPSNTEILYALGLEDRIVGVTDCCDYPLAAADKPKVGGFITGNVERVLAAEPDLVFASRNTEDVASRLRTLGMTVVILNPQTVDGVLRDIELAGKVTGQEAQASACVEELQQRIQAVIGMVENQTERPSVAHIVWYDPLWVSGRGTFQDEVITMAGGTNAFGSVEEWSIVSLEEFITSDPDYILVSSGSGMNRDGYDAVYNYVISEPRLQGLSAVRNNHVYVVDADVVSRGSPRIVDALEEVAGDLHPDLFGTGTPKAAETVQSPGIGVLSLICALSAAILLWKRG
ncbi:ABC transporter substrate-binding protein [Methanoculleus nereidis]|nr:cobalamin-binding protein [Methanoculleus sp. YWC-01]